MVKFTLLMCIYIKEDPLNLNRCLNSINKQTVMPDEVVIVKDGPVTSELEYVLESHRFKETPQHPVSENIITLPENVTLGPARAAGVSAAKNEWIAIMDSDDICRPDRFEKQLKMIEKNPKLGLIGGQAEEFSDETGPSGGPGRRGAIRTVPTDHNDIIKFAKIRNPFNHMTVMFKRNAVLMVGNYRYFPYFEDYDLWTRMIKNGTICANHPDVLVDARTDKDTYRRRRGSNYINQEWRMQEQLKELGLISSAEFIRNTTLRVPIRLLPGGMLASIYKKVLRDK